MGHHPQQSEQHKKPPRSRHTGKRRWVTYVGYALLYIGGACLAVHLVFGWRLVEIDWMLPTYLWIASVALVVLGPILILANEGVRSLAGTVPVVLGQVVSEPAEAERAKQRLR